MMYSGRKYLVNRAPGISIKQPSNKVQFDILGDKPGCVRDKGHWPIPVLNQHRSVERERSKSATLRRQPPWASIAPIFVRILFLHRV